jgi:hypothetical protein
MHRGIVWSAALLLVAAGSGWLWWSQVRQDPNRVFWDMVSNNLSTTGVTRETVQSGQGLTVSQYTQLSFTQHPTAHVLAVFKQGNSTLSTEEISDMHTDMVRYNQISIPAKSGKSLNTAAVVGKWAQLGSGQSVGNQLTSGLFSQSLLDVLPMANLQPGQCNQLLATMRTQGLFTYDKSLVKKARLNGRESYLYAVSIKPAAYIRVMQQFERMIGATSYASLKPKDYARQKPISIVLAVDARSHLLAQSYEVAAQRTERYQGFGLTPGTPLPKATITTTQLTQRLGQLQQ